MLHGTAVNWETWTADPKTTFGSPIADQSTGSNEVSLAAAVKLRVASEEMYGAEIVHTYVATMLNHSDECCQPM